MTHKEFYTKQLAKLNERKAKLEASLIECDVKEERSELGEALKAIAEEITELVKQIDEADEPAEEPATDEPARSEDTDNERKLEVLKTMEIRNGQTNETEARAKAFAENGKTVVNATELRSVLLTTESIAKPVGVGEGATPHGAVSSIVDQVKHEDCEGMGAFKEPVIWAYGDADVGTDGQLANESDPQFKTVDIVPCEVNILTYISKQIKKQSPVKYEEKVRECALVALRKKVASLIVNGTGINQPSGIFNATTTDKLAMVATVEASAITETTLTDLVFGYGGDETAGGAGVLYLNKKDLMAFGAVRGSDKKPVYEITPNGENPNTGVIKLGGLSVNYCINSAIKAFADAEAGAKCMTYGAPANYELGIFGDFEVTVSEDYKFGEGMLTVRGDVMLGGNVSVRDGFVVLTKTA